MDIQSTIKEIKQLHAGGDTESACRLSGQSLAYYDNLLRTEASTQNINCFLQLAKLHVTTLMLQRMQQDATSCLLITLCTADIHGATERDEHSPLLMDLLVLLTMSMTEQLNNTIPTPETEKHAAPMMAHTAILLRHYRQKAVNAADKPAGHLFAAAEQTIAQLGNIPVDDPALLIDGERPNPAAPKTMLAEIIGNASALGLLQF